MITLIRPFHKMQIPPSDRGSQLLITLHNNSFRCEGTRNGTEKSPHKRHPCTRFAPIVIPAPSDLSKRHRSIHSRCPEFDQTCCTSFQFAMTPIVTGPRIRECIPYSINILVKLVRVPKHPVVTISAVMPRLN